MTGLTVLFWNVHLEKYGKNHISDKDAITAHLELWIRKHQINLIVLAEAPKNYVSGELLGYLNVQFREGGVWYLAETSDLGTVKSGRGRTIFILNHSSINVSKPEFIFNDDISLIIERTPVRGKMLYLPQLCVFIAALHLKSRFNPEENENNTEVFEQNRFVEATDIASIIREAVPMAAEAYNLTKKDMACVIVGDFNMNPWEPAIINPEGFDAQLIKPQTRSSRYYNPFAALWGDVLPGQIPGTYRHGPESRWHLFDYALFSRASVRMLDMEFLRVEYTRLVRALWPDFNPSDHAPVLFRLRKKSITKQG